LDSQGDGHSLAVNASSIRTTKQNSRPESATTDSAIDDRWTAWKSDSASSGTLPPMAAGIALILAVALLLFFSLNK